MRGQRCAVAVVTVVALAGGCGGQRPTLAQSGSSSAGPTSSAAPRTPASAPDLSFVATATPTLKAVNVYSTASLADSPAQSLAQPNEDGAPLVFLVKGPYDPARSPGAIEVLLPVRPNGSSGFVRASDVTVTEHHFRIKVEIGEHRLTVTKAGVPLLVAPVGIGTVDTPTPGGRFYLKELLKVPDPTGPYGPYAYGLSGFSDVLTHFAGGNGVIGIHGTNEPSSIGKDVSHGCIRMSNENITMLVGVLPLGTPVDILA